MKTRRVPAAFGAAVAAALCLAGCVSSGTVTDKGYSEPYTTCSHTPTLNCTERDECWRLHLRSNRGDLGETCVSRQEWESIPVGSYYEGGAP